MPDDVFDKALTVLLAPVWLPVDFLHARRRRKRLDAILKGTAEQAWARAREVWSSAGAVYGGMVAFDTDAPFEHELASEFAWRHPGSKLLVESEMLDKDPLVAAYAFKVLIRLEKLTLASLPLELLQRNEKIRIFAGACIGDRITLSEFLRGYFDSLSRGAKIP